MNPHICFVSSYPPRECGIATFAHDLRHAIGRLRSDAKTSVIAMTNTTDGYDYPREVVFEIRQHEIGDYGLAAEYANLSGFDVVCIQHEFGIFGLTLCCLLSRLPATNASSRSDWTRWTSCFA